MTTLYNHPGHATYKSGDNIDTTYCGRRVLGVVVAKRTTTCLRRQAGRLLRYPQTELVVKEASDN